MINMEQAIVFVFIGLALFIGGQFYGQYRITSRARYAVAGIQRGIEGYREALRHVLKTEHGLDLKDLDMAAMKWNISQSLQRVQDEAMKAMKEDHVFTTTDVEVHHVDGEGRVKQKDESGE